MKIYDYGNTKNCVICGSIDDNLDKFIKIVIDGLRDLKHYVIEPHPKEIERQERLAKRESERNPLNNIGRGGFQRFEAKTLLRKCGYDLSESVIIVNGCNSFGTRDLKYYYDKLEMLNTILADNNSYVLFVRGNDDPKYYEDELINLSNIKTIQDYSIVKLNKFNCLCIGGCVSIDRTWKIQQEKRIGKKMYWENENLNHKEDEINEIINKYNIACVVSASCPSFAQPGMNYFKRSPWASKDKNIIKDMTKERMIMDKIYNKIIEKDKKPYAWVYSRFKDDNQNVFNDIIFQSLAKLQFFHFNQTIHEFFKIDFSETFKKNEFVAKLLKKKRLANFLNTDPFDENRMVMEHNDEMEDLDDEIETAGNEEEENNDGINFEPYNLGSLVLDEAVQQAAMQFVQDYPAELRF